MASHADSKTDLACLTPREWQVLELISHGLTNGDVATRLGVTVHAVKFHLSSIYRKLGVTNRTEAAVAFFHDTTSQAAAASTWPPQSRAGLESASPQPAGQAFAIPALDLPTDHPRAPETGVAVAREETTLPQDLTVQLGELAASLGVHVASVLLAAFGTLLYRYAGQHDFAIGLSGSQPLRLDLSSTESFAETVARVETRLGEPYADDPALVPQVVFSVFEGHGEPEVAPGSGSGGCDLALIVRLEASEVGVALEFDHGLFEAATIRRMIGHLLTLLEAGAADRECSIANLSILTAGEQHQLLVEWNATDQPYPCCRADELIAAQASTTPESVALESGAERLTYSELETRANQLAHHLQSLGVGPDVLVGICVERSLEMVVGLLGIMKAGGAYVPIDPSFPAERQRFMLQDAEVRVLLTQEALLAVLPPHEAEVVCLDRDAARIATAGADPPLCDATPDHLAYVIYTSGSTGRPKGVQIPQRALVNFLTTMGERPGMTAEDVLVAVTTLSFDIAGLELYLPLVSGARVVIAARETAADPRRLAELIERSAATLVQATPTTWRMLMDAGWPGRSGLKVLCGGEALPRVLAEQLLERGVELWNMYGPTETTIWSAVRPVTTLDEPLTIGRPIANTTLYILDDRLQPVPVGIPGELHIGGEGMARGYLKRPELSAERFIAHPFDRTPGARLYKTGDLARYRSDGNVEFLGRLDHQVKVRGFRIELGEIEATLGRHPAVEAAVVTTREDSPGDVRLVGYVISSGELQANELRRYAGESLPSYMVPSAIVTLEEFPLTPNGKIDRKALPAPSTERSEEGYVAPRTPLEQRLAAIWEDVLGVRPIGVTDDFFDLGATSIVAAQLFTEIEKGLGADLPIVPIFQAPTIEQLAQLVDQGVNGRRWSSLVPIQPNGSQPPIFCVHGGAGTVLHLQPLARRLGSEQPFYGLQAPGLYGDVPPVASIEAMSELYISELREIQPRGPYYIAGYCFGGIVAFDMAHRLLDAGEEVALLTMFNAPSPAYIHSHYLRGSNTAAVSSAAGSEAPAGGGRARPLTKVARLVRRPSRMRFIARSRWDAFTLDRRRRRILDYAHSGRPLPEGLRDRGYLIICNLLEWSYAPRPYQGELLLFNGSGLYDDDPELGWSGFASQITSFTVPGEHPDNRATMRDPHVHFIADRMRAFLDGSTDAAALPQ